MLPVLAISTLSGLLARPYIRPGTEEITATYIDDLDLALKNITEAQDYFGKMRASFESLSVSKKEIEAELVELKEARSIEKKTLHRRMRIYKEKSFWLRLLTYLATFVSGVGASLAASYIKEYLQNVP